MRGQSPTRFADRAIGALAGRQFGVVAHRQLIALGLTPRQIEWRLTTGRLTQLHRGVYLVGAAKPAHAHEIAALMACGEVPSAVIRGAKASLSHNLAPAAVLSHRTASDLWGLLPYPASEPVWISVAPGRRIERRGIKVVRATLDPRDIRRNHTMPLTSPPRTILDLAATLGGETLVSDPLAPHRLDDLEQLVAQAIYRRLASEAELRDQIARNSGKRGNKALRTVLDLPGGPRRTRSGGERAMLRLLRAREIEGYEVNAEAFGYEVDFLWRAERLAVEVDGWDGHSSRAAFERDRMKSATLQANGVAVMPVTARQIRDGADGVVDRLLAALRAAR